jgi:V/A-type H+-transporting ATPase subunit C
MSDSDTMVVHFNALVHALKSQLLPQVAYEEYLSLHSVERMSESLLDSSYRKEMAEALTRGHGADAIEEAVQLNRARQFAMLARRASGDFGDLVNIFLSRMDLAAVKFLVRAKHHGLKEEEITAAGNPGVSMTQPQFHDLARAESMEDLVTQLLAWNSQLCRPLRGALAEYREKNDPAILEDALDMEYFSKSARALRGIEDENAKALSWYLRVEIDRINLRLIFQCFQYKGDKDAVATRLVPGGTLTSSQLQSMLGAADATAAMDQLSGTRYQALGEQLFQFLQTNRFAPVERRFDRLVATQLRRLALNDPFGIGVVMDYVWLKYNEGVNLRLIARGLAGSVPVGRVRDELFLQN